MLAGCCLVVGVFAMGNDGFAITKKKLVNPVTSEPADGTPADFIADKVVYDPRSQTAVATGTVRMVYGPYQLIATKVTYNQKTGAFTANGSVELREPNGNILRASEIFLKDKFKAGFARHLEALLTNDARISSIYAVRSADGTTVYEKAHYTACGGCETQSGQPLWEVVTTKTVHDEKSKTLYHTSPRLKIGGVTVAGLPYAEMPDPSVKRRTGFLPPTFKVGDHYGFGPITPYYWAPAPNYDVTFSPLWSFKQGPVADVEWRHRLTSGSYSVRGFGTYQLDLRNAIETDRRWRGAIKTKGRFALSKDWKWGWDGVLASDKMFLRNYDFDQNRIGYNDAYLTGLWDQSYLDIRALHHVPLATAIYNAPVGSAAFNDWDALPTALPYVTGSHIFQDPFVGGELQADWNSYSIRRDEADTPFTDVNHGTTQSRAVLDLRWKKQVISDLGTVATPFLKLRSDVYATENVPDSSVPGGLRDSETTVRILPAAGLDLRWPFIANQFGGQSIVTPVFQIIAAGNETQRDSIGNEDAITLNFDHSSLFLDDRFTGLDRHEGGTRANVGLTYAYYGDGGSYLRASVGESFHIAGANSFAAGSGLEGTKSDLVAAVTGSPLSWLTLSYEGRIEEDLSDFNRHEASVGLTFDSFTANAGYQFIAAEPLYGRETTEEFVFANGRYNLSPGWYAFGGANYDLHNDFLKSTTLGVEFDCDCMNSKLAYSSYKGSENGDVDHRVMFSIELSTIGHTSFSSRF